MRRIGIIVVAALVLLLPLIGHAYVLEETRYGETLHWDRSHMPVGWYLNKGGTADLGQTVTQQVLLASFNTWSAIECSYLAYTYKGVVDVTPNDVGTEDYDGKNVMIWIEPGDWPGEWVDAFAVTVPLFEERTGKIVDADILFNRSFDWSIAVEGEAGKADLQSIATHEIGHMCGLDHPPVPDATMYWSAVEGETHKRDLAADDIQGLCHIYPRAGYTGGICSGDSDCEDNRLCVEHEASAASICSPPCDCTADCPAGFTCQDGRCLPPLAQIGGVGAECSTTKPCGDDELICVNGLCTTYCTSAAEDCLAGWECLKLLGDPGSACYTDDESLIPGRIPESPVTITALNVSPDEEVEPGTNVTISCQANGAADLMYRFSVRAIGGDWKVLKDFSLSAITHWTPTAGGAYEVLAEVTPQADNDACPDTQLIVGYLVKSDDSDSDGDVDGDGSEVGDGGGCASAPPAWPGAVLLLVAFWLVRRRARDLV